MLCRGFQMNPRVVEAPGVSSARGVTAGFRRTLVGLKQLPVVVDLGLHECFQMNPRWIGKELDAGPDRSGCWFQTNLVGLKHDGPEHDGRRDVLQTNSREVEETQVWVFSPSRPCFR